MAVEYDPIKEKLGVVFNAHPLFRKLFYRLLDLLLLRAWHIKREIRRWKKERPGRLCILDAGSGFGQYSYYLARSNRGWQVEGVDIKQEQVDDCNRFFQRAGVDNASFAYADLTEYRKRDAYDLILGVDIMEHIERDDIVFRNFFHSLKEGGVLLLSTPSDQGGSDVHHDDHDSFIGEHVRDGYPVSEMQDKLNDAGFSDISIRYSYGGPGRISWKLSMKYPLILLNYSKLFLLLLPFYYVLLFPPCLLLNYLDVTGRHETGTGLIVKAVKHTSH